MPAFRASFPGLHVLADSRLVFSGVDFVLTRADLGRTMVDDIFLVPHLTNRLQGRRREALVLDQDGKFFPCRNRRFRIADRRGDARQRLAARLSLSTLTIAHNRRDAQEGAG